MFGCVGASVCVSMCVAEFQLTEQMLFDINETFNEVTARGQMHVYPHTYIANTRASSHKDIWCRQMLPITINNHKYSYDH